MTLTSKQEEGLRIAVSRYKAREPYTCIAGYAGTGKSTLIRFIIAALNIGSEDVCYITFTGKAASVLQQKGCQNAKTAHKLLYYAQFNKETGKYKFVPRKALEERYKLIVVDEVSMLPKNMWDLLLTHKIPVIALGDPGQLPPIVAEDNNHILDHPHVFLDEIMRQAQESEIIRLSMHIRKGESINSFEAIGEQVQIFSPKEVVDGMFTWADQILCATNEKRENINHYVRKMLNYQDTPQVGDKVISLRNHWDVLSTSGDWALTNGTIGYIENLSVQKIQIPKFIYAKPIDYMYTNIKLDSDDTFQYLPIDYNYLLTGQSVLTTNQKVAMNASKYSPDAPLEFTYAYAMTTWKAQGSEWNKILGYEEAFPYDKETHKRFLYTMATRASEKLVLIKKE